MSKRFYLTIFVILSLSVVVLSATYSKDSGTSEYVAINKEKDNLRITFEHGETIPITRVNKLKADNIKGSNISIVNKHSKDVNVLIELNYLGNEEVYYSVDNSEMRLILNHAKEVVSLRPFGMDGDQHVFNIKVLSLKDTNERVSINISVLEDDFLKTNLVNDEQVFKDNEGNYIYYGQPNNYIRYNDRIYRIIGLINSRFKIISIDYNTNEFNEENSYLSVRDFLRTFNNREVDESNMDLFDSWLKEYNDYWFDDGRIFVNNTIVDTDNGRHTSSEVLELSDYIVLSGGDGTKNNPYEVKYES